MWTSPRETEAGCARRPTRDAFEASDEVGALEEEIETGVHGRDLT